MSIASAPEKRMMPAEPGVIRVGLREHIARYGKLGPSMPLDRAWIRSAMSAISESGLRGRGGALFPTAKKWASLNEGRRRPVVVVNGMESEPASLKDRMLLSVTPHLVLDGAEVAATITGAREIILCIADNSDASAASVELALRERADTGVLDHRISIQRPPGRYVSGEETAVVGWINNRRSLPTLRLDKSVPLEVSRSPVVVHNTESLAQVALIARYGSDWFRQLGTAEAPGSTLVTVSGDRQSPTVVEVEFGMSVIDIVRLAGLTGDLAGALVGGYGGAWLAAHELATPYAPGPLAAAGSAIGVGIVVALPSWSCGLAETARIARYMAGQSAGQCGPCVFGLPALATDLEQLAVGRPDGSLIESILGHADAVDGRGACRHPDGVARLVRSALGAFSYDVFEHAAGRPCAGYGGKSVMRFPASRAMGNSS